MFESLKADIQEHRQAKYAKEAPAGPRDQAHALSGYSLWLLPPVDAEKRLSELVFNLSKGAGSPAFMPHITLFTAKGAARTDPDRLEKALHRAINVSSLARQASSADSTVAAGDRGIGRMRGDGEAYDRPGESKDPGLKLLLDAPQPGDRYYQSVLSPVDPASAVGLVALRQAVAEALGESALPFFPHLSLCYGEFGDQEKEQIAAQAAERANWPMEVTCNVAAVVDINGTADQWKIVTVLKLT